MSIETLPVRPSVAITPKHCEPDFWHEGGRGGRASHLNFVFHWPKYQLVPGAVPMQIPFGLQVASSTALGQRAEAIWHVVNGAARRAHVLFSRTSTPLSKRDTGGCDYLTILLIVRARAGEGERGSVIVVDSRFLCII